MMPPFHATLSCHLHPGLSKYQLSQELSYHRQRKDMKIYCSKNVWRQLGSHWEEINFYFLIKLKFV